MRDWPSYNALLEFTSFSFFFLHYILFTSCFQAISLGNFFIFLVKLVLIYCFALWSHRIYDHGRYGRCAWMDACQSLLMGQTTKDLSKDSDTKNSVAKRQRKQNNAHKKFLKTSFGFEKPVLGWLPSFVSPNVSFSTSKWPFTSCDKCSLDYL